MTLFEVLDLIAEHRGIGDQHVCICGDPIDGHNTDHTPINRYAHDLDILERRAALLGAANEGERIWQITKAMCGRKR